MSDAPKKSPTEKAAPQGPGGQDANLRDVDGHDPSVVGALSDGLRKALFSGISAVFTSEEGIRQAVGEMPKEAMAYFAAQTEKSRKELFRVAADEVKGFLNNVDLTGEIRKAITGLKLEVKAEVRFVDEENAETKINVGFAPNGDAAEDAGSGKA